MRLFQNLLTLLAIGQTEACEPVMANGCCGKISVSNHGIRDVPDPLDMLHDASAASTRYSCTEHNYQLIEHQGYLALVENDDFNTALCYKKKMKTCPRDEFIFNCYKKATIPGFKDGWISNNRMRIECVECPPEESSGDESGVPPVETGIPPVIM